MTINKSRISKKLKLLGYLSVITGLDTNGHVDTTKANKNKTPNNSVNLKGDKRKTVATPTSKATVTPNGTTATPNASTATLRVFFRGKEITKHLGEILRKLGNVEMYYMILSVEEIVSQMIEVIKEEARKNNPTITDESLANISNMMEEQKEKMVKEFTASKDTEMIKLTKKYKELLDTSIPFATVNGLLLILQSLQEADRKLAHKITKLKDEYTHKLHHSTLYGIKVFAELNYSMISYQQQLGKGQMSDENNALLGQKILELTGKFMTNRIESLKGATGFLEALKKLLIDHYGEEGKSAVDSTENYCTISGKTYGLIQLIDLLLQQVSETQGKIVANVNNPSLSMDIETLFIIMNAYILNDINKDLKAD